MNNLKPFFALPVLLMLLMFSGCAATQTALPKMDEVSSLKGQTTEEILGRFGPPDGRYTDSNNNIVWEYRRPTASRSGTNLYTAIASGGFASGSDSLYVDIMRLTFYHDVVANYTFTENTMSGAMGLGQTNNQNPPAMTVDQAIKSPPPEK
ncbi:MAG: hypothetical protein K0A99_07665 [Desulfoarculaceae bacterium]|nr:hypothetical protein [Desulfoarculaceae bacterium]